MVWKLVFQRVITLLAGVMQMAGVARLPQNGDVLLVAVGSAVQDSYPSMSEGLFFGIIVVVSVVALGTLAMVFQLLAFHFRLSTSCSKQPVLWSSHRATCSVLLSWHTIDFDGAAVAAVLLVLLFSENEQ